MGRDTGIPSKHRPRRLQRADPPPTHVLRHLRRTRRTLKRRRPRVHGQTDRGLPTTLGRPTPPLICELSPVQRQGRSRGQDSQTASHVAQGSTGSLNHDRFLSDILQLRNTPDPDGNLSPAQIIFGRPLRDTLSFVNRLEKFTNPHIRPLWREAWSAKEDALRARFTRTTEKLEAHSRPLRPLLVGERVFLQNQQGPHPTKWDRSGVIVESLSHDQYPVKVDGSGRLTLRNRRFLRAYTPATPTIQTHQPFVKPSGVNKKHERPSPVGPDLGVSSPTPAVAPNSNPTDRAQSPPTTASPPPDDFEPQPGTVNPELPAPPLDSPTGTTLRPRSSLNPPKHYEPETGTWILGGGGGGDEGGMKTLPLSDRRLGLTADQRVWTSGHVGFDESLRTLTLYLFYM